MVRVRVTVFILSSESANREASDVMLRNGCLDPDIRGQSESEASDMVSVSVLSNLPLAVVARFWLCTLEFLIQATKTSSLKKLQQLHCVHFFCLPDLDSDASVLYWCEATRRTCSLMVFVIAEALLLTIWA
jgi:hypothetical protein